MKWLNIVVDEAIERNPNREIIVSSGVSPSGTYHLGTLREVLTAEAIMRELIRRGRQSRHLHIVDDLDVFRKVPKGLPEEFEKYLGLPLCDVPSPDESAGSYADYYLNDLLTAAKSLNLQMEVVRSHEKYRTGFFVPAIEKSLDATPEIRQILESISGHRLDDHWSPVQVVEEGYLKNRPFVAIDKDLKTITYRDKDEKQQQVRYDAGKVKLNWRIDWPARWWLMEVQVEPFGRDHATKGGSYDTGAAIIEQVFGAKAPIPLPYNFINRTGETKKMSKSAGDTVTAAELLEVLPAEVVWYFILRFSPDKQLFFDESATLAKLIDDFSELLAKDNKTAEEQQLIELCTKDIETPTVSNVPFSHLVASYQSALKDQDKTLDIISRTEYKQVVDSQKDTIKNELTFIENWLSKWAPEEARFDLRESATPEEFSEAERVFLAALAEKISHAPADASGEWFHKAIYELGQTLGLQPKDIFAALYRLLIGKSEGPRAGWFLSILPRDWLVKRLKFET